jgi:hypothetical protein
MSFASTTKHSASLNAISKNSGSFEDGAYYLLQENLSYLLQENGGRILLNDSYNYKRPVSWTEETKHTSTLIPLSKNTASWVAQTKH